MADDRDRSGDDVDETIEDLEAPASATEDVEGGMCAKPTNICVQPTCIDTKTDCIRLSLQGSQHLNVQ